MWDHGVLQHFSEHETSGEGLPLDLFHEMLAAKNVHAGIDTLQQVSL